MTTSTPSRRRTWSVADYQAMHAAGLLTAGDQVELLDGEVVQKVVIGPRHAGGVTRLQYALMRCTADVLVSVQNPVVVGLRSQPEPDLAVLRRRDDFYAGGHPTVADVLLLVEVADSSTAVDRRAKLPLYAAAGVPEVWLVDLEAGGLEVHREPGPAGYARVDRLSEGAVSCAQEPALSITVAEALGQS